MCNITPENIPYSKTLGTISQFYIIIAERDEGSNLGYFLFRKWENDKIIRFGLQWAVTALSISHYLKIQVLWRKSQGSGKTICWVIKNNLFSITGGDDDSFPWWHMSSVDTLEIISWYSNTLFMWTASCNVFRIILETTSYVTLWSRVRSTALPVWKLFLVN